MSYFAFKLLFAVLALGLLVVLALIMRRSGRKRQAGRPRPPQAAAPAANAAGPRVGLGRKVPVEPAPDPAAPPPPRRRQLASFVASERVAAEAEAPELPSVGTDASAEPAEAAPRMPEAAEARESEAAEPPVVAPAEFEQAVLDHLELAFDAFQSGEITLDGYRARVLNEKAEVERQIARHQASGDEIGLEAAVSARESLHWCLDWADEQESAPEG